MTGSSPGPNGQESSSSSVPLDYHHAAAEDLDGDDQADLGTDNALLADDPPDEEAVNAP